MYKKISKKYSISIIIILFFTFIVTYNINQNKLIETVHTFEHKEYVYPLGNVVGIKATTDGILVVGFEDDSIEYIGGIRVGDNIVKINNKKIDNISDISNILNDVKGDYVEVIFERNNEYKKDTIKINREDKMPRLGIWVRDKISGIGTMTFYNPNTNKFSGIGHPITDVDTNKLLNIKNGYIYNPTHLEIIKGTNYKIGQIKGEFNTINPIGEFNNNNSFGISGKLINKNNNNIQLIEVAKEKDIKLGQAYILFEDINRNIVSYDIDIIDINYNSKNHKNFTIEIIDDKLIDYTGGIIQGMSGAPIIQNNKIIGAITHVFKDNYKKGYGIFINEMIELDSTY